MKEEILKNVYLHVAKRFSSIKFSRGFQLPAGNPFLKELTPRLLRVAQYYHFCHIVFDLNINTVWVSVPRKLD
jgi:hypothetical protein